MSDLNINELLNTRKLLPEKQKQLLEKNAIHPNKVNDFFVAKKTEKPFFLNGCISCSWGCLGRRCNTPKNLVKNTKNF